MPDHTFVISRAPSEAASPGDVHPAQYAERRSFEDCLAAALAAAGARVLSVPHVYYLTPDHPATARLASLDGPIVLAAWLHPRPTYWTLRALGIQGERATSLDELAAASQERRIHCCDLRPFASPDECLAAFQPLVPTPDAPAQIERIAHEPPPRWYPVLDYSLCAACKKCFDFCLFGVYSVLDKRVVATEPDRCKPGCPACARVCPKGAITFPHCPTDPPKTSRSRAFQSCKLK